MKISGYWKDHGANVTLINDYSNLDDYDSVYISKVFTDTPFPSDIVETGRIHLGGTGFYFDKAPNLPEEIEHHMPDYHLYDNWIDEQLKLGRGGKSNDYKFYRDYSIGFLTRGCFRKCSFCVNQKYDRVFCHSPLEEFYDPDRKKICLLDDNFLGLPKWKESLKVLRDINKPFVFRQGLDERLLTDEKCELLFNSKYDGDFIFAFDNISDYELIHQKLQLIRKHTNSTQIKFYVLVGFESTDELDIENMFKRIALLFEYRCIPYIMRYQSQCEQPWKKSKYKTLYSAVSSWCNQPSFVKKQSFREFCLTTQESIKTDGKICSRLQALLDFESEYPEIAAKYFDLKFGEIDPIK